MKPNNCHAGHLSQKKEKLYSLKSLHMHVYSSLTRNSPKLEVIQMSILKQ